MRSTAQPSDQPTTYVIPLRNIGSTRDWVMQIAKRSNSRGFAGIRGDPRVRESMRNGRYSHSLGTSLLLSVNH